MTDSSSLEFRLAKLEQSLGRNRLVSLSAIAVALIAISMTAFQRYGNEVTHEIRTRRVVVVDDAGRVRVTIDQDDADVDRRSRSAGVTIYDADGAERGGMATMDDGSAVIALDAPAGIGNATPDRAGMIVQSNGAAMIAVLDNQANFVATLQSNGAGGGLQLYEPGTDNARTLRYADEQRNVLPESP